MSSDSPTISFDRSVEWNRHLKETYSAVSTDRFVEAAFSFLRATVRCDMLLFHNSVRGDEFSVLRDSGGNDSHPDIKQAAVAFSPATAYGCVNRRAKFVSTCGILPENEMELMRSPIYNGVVKPFGMRYSVSMLFWGIGPSRCPESAFSVFRSSRESDFSKRDFAALETARLHLETALACLKSRLNGSSKRDGLAAIVQNLPLGSILLNWNLDIIHANRAGVRNCVSWVRGVAAENLKIQRGDYCVPVEIENACRELQCEWTASRKKNSRPKFRKLPVEHMTQRGLHATVTILGRRDAMIASPSFLIQIERREPTPSAARWKRLLLLDLLTTSEREVTLRVVDGLSNQEIASELGKTVCAIKFLLHSTFKKLQVSNRVRLITLLHEIMPGSAEPDHAR
jgi:DNA-binding CsgD family transcriptional regulator